ncbi:tautomerase family protein [Aquabacterium sp. A7-Y]|uniref:tautomerase family protein n=1 Tax=Aquabacterium sp. A7-Y TaxID=1349605 RepID=UPI00223E65AD|nr:tautomerase family protein [Aquabacterium sp. A7-Y]MCW7539299.1 tautomerase family protein [Aquabacterium sp. A7-Y]
MPVVQITTWPLKDEGAARALVEGVTRVVHESVGAPLDKISVYITEVPPTRWADAGVLGSDPEFRAKSRRLAYGDTP